MILGILFAILAGVLLGLYALPEKYTHDFAYENTWGLFFLINLIVLPFFVATVMIDHFGAVLLSLSPHVLITMIIASIFWGIGVQMWSKAIDYIGMSLGFSIFIGTVILVGSILPFIRDGLPKANALAFIIGGLIVILLGVFCNGKAGLLRSEDRQIEGLKDSQKMGKGILIAVIGGVLAAGFSLANAVGANPIHEAMLREGNPAWKTALAIMVIIYMAGALYVLPYFMVQLNKNQTWEKFKTPHFIQNVSMATIMAVFNFAASVVFAYAAFALGSAGNTVGYAIYNTSSVLFAVIGGILTSEWVGAPKGARLYLYVALWAMSAGVILIAIGNAVNS